MNKLLSFALLLMPVLSFGQKIEITETAGMSWERQGNSNFFSKANGPSNQVGVNYYFTKYLSAGVYHELNSWNADSHTFGLAADGHFRHLSLGINVGEMYIDAKTYKEYSIVEYSYPGGVIIPFTSFSTTVKPNPALVLGAHAAMDQCISKHFFVKEQVAYNYASCKGTAYGDNYSIRVHYVSAMVGVGFRF